MFSECNAIWRDRGEVAGSHAPPGPLAMPFIEDDWWPENEGRMVDLSNCLQVGSGSCVVALVFKFSCNNQFKFIQLNLIQLNYITII